MSEPCPLCGDTGLDPRHGLAPREVILRIEDQIPPRALIRLADILRVGGRFTMEVDAPPGGGIACVEIELREKFTGKKGA